MEEPANLDRQGTRDGPAGEDGPPQGSLLGRWPFGTPRIPLPMPFLCSQEGTFQGKISGLILMLFFFFFFRIGGEEIAFVSFFPSCLNMTSDLQAWKTT